MKKGKITSDLTYFRDNVTRWLVKRVSGRTVVVNIVIIFLLGSLLVYLAEKARNPEISNYGDALWLMIVTMTTVGFGDIVPVTVLGKTFTALAMVLGVGALSAYLTTRAARRAQRSRGRLKGVEKITRGGGHIVVCGWNPRGSYMITRLTQEIRKRHMHIVLLCALDDSPIDDDDIYFFSGSQESEADLKRVNIPEADTVILLADETRGGDSSDIDARTVLAALTIRSLNPGIKMTAEVLDPENKHHLELAGVGEILDSNMLLGNLIARSALHHGLINTVTEMVARGVETHASVIKASGHLVGMSRGELRTYLAEKGDAQLLMIVTSEGSSPSEPDYRLAEGDDLIIFSREEFPHGD